MKCQFCGKELADDQLFCGYCGYRVRSEEKNPKDSSAEPRLIDSGICGAERDSDSMRWQMFDNGDLKITGRGEMMQAHTIAPWYKMVPWYAYRSEIRRVLISDGVRTIGGHMFRECGNLEMVVIPKSVTRIELWAFYGCENLSEIRGAEKVSFIGANAFRDCTRLQDKNGFIIVNGILTEWLGMDRVLQIPEGVSVIGVWAFSSDRSREIAPEAVIIPEGVKKIESRAFYGCKGLRLVDIPDSVEEIGAWCFRGCGSLESVHINERIERQISGSAFSNCALGGDGSALIIGGKLFRYGGGEISYTVPQDVKEISPHSFENCDSLQEIIVPETVKKIGHNAFENCQNLRRVVVKSPIHRFGDSTFKNCVRLESVVLPDTIECIEISEFERCKNLKTIQLPRSVREIRRSAFSQCVNLEEVRLPEGLWDDDIDPSAFFGCDKLADARLRQFMEPDSWNPNHRKFFRDAEAEENKNERFVKAADFLMNHEQVVRET